MMLSSPAFTTPFQLVHRAVSVSKRVRYRSVKTICSSASDTSVYLHPTPTRPAAPGHLYLVSVPIGNTRDITLRAQDILSSADIIAAEDTRRTRALLSALSLQLPVSQQIISCHEHNARARIPGILNSLSSGQSVAIVSDAGTPCVSDPGSELVSAAVAAGRPIIPVPGASAPLTALIASALPSRQFCFTGFLPRTKEARLHALEGVAKSTSTCVLFEAPHRMRTLLEELMEAGAGEKKVCLGRELTKKYEQFLRFDTVKEAREFYNQEDGPQPRGEYTIVLGPKEKVVKNRDDLEEYDVMGVDVAKLVKGLVKQGVSVKTIASCVAQASEVPKKVVYSYASACKEEMSKGVEEISA